MSRFVIIHIMCVCTCVCVYYTVLVRLGVSTVERQSSSLGALCHMVASVYTSLEEKAEMKENKEEDDEEYEEGEEEGERKTEEVVEMEEVSEMEDKDCPGGKGGIVSPLFAAGSVVELLEPFLAHLHLHFSTNQVYTVHVHVYTLYIQRRLRTSKFHA